MQSALKGESKTSFTATDAVKVDGEEEGEPGAWPEGEEEEPGEEDPEPAGVENQPGQ